MTPYRYVLFAGCSAAGDRPGRTYRKLNGGNDMSLRDLQTGFELDDDMLGTAAGGAFSDIRTNVQIVVNELNATGSLSQWKTLSREDKVSKLQKMAESNRRIFSMISAFGGDRLVMMVDDTIG